LFCCQPSISISAIFTGPLPANHQQISNIYRSAASQASAFQQYLPVRCQPSIDVSAIFTGPLPANHQHIGNTYRSVASQASIT
jgi:hypothetical protein